MSATNHSGWLVLVLNSKEKLEMLIEIFKGKELKEGKSLQELLATRLLYSESNDEQLLFNSTLQFLLDFPDFPRSFVKLHFSIESGNFPSLRMYKLDETICLDRIVEIVVSKNLVCLLSSVAGSGKTTVLREIAFQLRKENTELKIVHISLASISNELMKKSHSNEFEFLAESTNRSLEDVNNWISSKKFVVLIDGFDEIYFKYQNKMLRLIESLSKNMVPVMIGTRPHKAALIKKAVKNAVILKIEPLKKNQQIEFLKLETGKSEDDCKSFIEKFPKKDILQNPLHLSLVAQSGGRGNLYQIYEQVVRLKVEMCLKNRVGLDATHNQFEIETDSAMSFLQRIAFCYLGQAKRFGREGRIEDMEKLNGYGVAMFQNDRIIFLHETFAEFLAARKFVHDVEEANGLFKPSNFFDEEKTIFEDECDFRECWKFVDMYYSTIQRDAQKVNLHKNALLHAVKSNPDAFLEFVVFENLRSMYSMIKSLMTFKKTKNGDSIYCRKDSLLLNYVIKNAEDIAVHFVETDMIEGEDPLLKILPNLLKRVAECNATLFFKKLKDKFPILPQLIGSKLSRRHRRRAAMEAARLGNEQILDMLLQSGVETDRDRRL
ncbi:uncharacterized protein LOC135937348 [Cloeon dipterum]|uniref:uncharacterized protein LOC135937348 n=1 Tax=Cloeon dipterum TaxID=197152 RepID=UPI00321FB998